MKYTIILDKEDYLTHQLYAAAKRPDTEKRMKKGRWFVLASFIAFALYGYFADKVGLSIYFAIFGGAFYFIYPIYFKWLFKRHYTKWVKQNFQSRFNEPVIIEFFEDHIYTKDKTGDGNINISEITSIDEIGQYFFIVLSTGNSIIIPKYKIQPSEGIDHELEKILSRDHVERYVDLDWKW